MWWTDVMSTFICCWVCMALSNLSGQALEVVCCALRWLIVAKLCLPCAWGLYNNCIVVTAMQPGL
jgi:hypothetical protein